MTRKVLRFSILLLVVAGAWSAYHFLFNDGTIRVTITRDRIDEALEKKFPKQDTYAKVIHVHYENPVVDFVPGEERITVSIDVRAELGLQRVLSKSYTGSATITTSLGYNPASNRFLLINPHLDELDLPGLSSQHLDLVKEGMNLATVLWFDDIPVYRIKDRKLKDRVARHVLREVRIKNNRIIAVLGMPQDQ